MYSRAEYLAGLLFIILSTLAWSLTGYFTRLVALDSMTIVAYRGFSGAASLLIVIILFKGKNWHREFTRIGKPELLYMGLSLIGNLSLITSYAHTSVAHCATVYATLPFFAAFAGWYFLGEIPTRSAIISGAAALVGFSVMMLGGSDGALLGDVLAAVMTLSTALTMVVIRKYVGVAAMGASCLSTILASLICFPFAASVSPASTTFGVLAVFGVTNYAIGLAFFILGSRRLRPVDAALVTAIDTPLAMVWVWLAFGEIPGWNTITGGAIVIAAVVAHLIVNEMRLRRNVPSGSSLSEQVAPVP